MVPKMGMRGSCGSANEREEEGRWGIIWMGNSGECNGVGGRIIGDQMNTFWRFVKGGGEKCEEERWETE